MNAQEAGVSNTSALAFGGASTEQTNEIWNGTSWTEVGDLNTGRQYGAGMGTVTAALAAGGLIPPATPSNSALAELWNGTSWTEVGDLTTARYHTYAAKQSSTAGLVFGGHDGTDSLALTEQWNGTAWTEVADLNQVKYGLAGAGTQAAAMAVAGSKTVPAAMATEEYTFPLEATVSFDSS